MPVMYTTKYTGIISIIQTLIIISLQPKVQVLTRVPLFTITLVIA